LGADDWTVLVDDDGTSCWAVVRERSGPIVTCEIDWSTWRTMRTEVEQPTVVGGVLADVKASGGFVAA
jgi:hypothetical protein